MSKEWNRNIFCGWSAFMRGSKRAGIFYAIRNQGGSNVSIRTAIYFRIYGILVVYHTLAFMASDRTLSSPNRMVWELFQALRRLCTRITKVHAIQDETALRQDTAICIILAVQCVEVFFNVYFRVLISEPAYTHAAKKISADLENRKFGLDGKIKKWPRYVFGKELDFDKGAGLQFTKLKNLRHSLMHFRSSHETFSIPGIAIHGLADTTEYESLSPKNAIEALQTVELLLCEVFTLRGITPENLPNALHSWTGRPHI